MTQHLPPKDIPAGELWVAMTEMPRPKQIVPFPRKGADGKPVGEVAIVVLRQDEQLRATIAAEQLVRAELPNAKQEDSLGYGIAFNNAASIEQLYRACRDPNDLDRLIFPNPKEMRRVMSVDEVGALYSSYLRVRAEIGPNPAELSKESAEAWLDKLIEGGNETDPLEWASQDLLRLLLRCSVDRIRSSRGAPSSAGTPLESGSGDRVISDAPAGDSIGED